MEPAKSQTRRTRKSGAPSSRPRRNAARKDKPKPPTPCIHCGEPASADHHCAGRANDNNLTAPVCDDMHREADADLRSAGVDLSHDAPRTMLERLIDVLIGVGNFLIRLGQTLCEWAKRLFGFLQALDSNYPGWRTLPEAH